MFEAFMLVAIVGAFLLGRFARWRNKQESCQVKPLTGQQLSQLSIEAHQRKLTETGWPKN